jgi:hypothetical protein
VIGDASKMETRVADVTSSMEQLERDMLE